MDITHFKCRRKLSEEDFIGLQTEIDIMKQVDHPNIVKMYSVFEDEKYLYLVMELLSGGEVSKSLTFLIVSYYFMSSCLIKF